MGMDKKELGEKMTDENQLLKKFSSILEDTKKRKINDFDGGLLNEAYEHITGTPEEKYERWCERLINVATRLNNVLTYGKHKHAAKVEEILENIDTFLTNELPQIRPSIDDYTQEQGRFIKVCRGDSKPESSCIQETFVKTVELIREEQYFKLINDAKKLEYQARSLLPNEVMRWHRDDMLGEIDPSDQEMDGKEDKEGDDGRNN